MTDSKIQIVFIPALLCDEALYAPVIERLGDKFEAHVMISPKPSLAESVTDILARAPDKFVLVGTSYAGNLALEIAIAAPERVTALWLMGCNPGAAEPGGPNLPGGLTATPDAVIDMLAGIIAHPDNKAAAATFKEMLPAPCRQPRWARGWTPFPASVSLQCQLWCCGARTTRWSRSP